MWLQKHAVFFVLIPAVFVVAGCDQMAAVKDYFQGNTREAARPEKPVRAPAAEKPQVRAPRVKPAPANVLVRVGDWTITVDEFNDRLAALKEIVPEYDTDDPAARRLVLDELVNQQLLVMGAERSGLANSKDIKAAVEEFRRTLIVREVARTLTENIAVTDEDARAFYDQNQDAMVGAAEWHVREIMATTKDEATRILGEILQGADFAEQARMYSKSDTASAGGDLGFITEEPFPQMGNAILSLEVGDVSGVFKGPDGYYIVKLEEKKDGAPISFEEIKKDIVESQTLLMQQQAILDHIDRLKASTVVEINDQLL